MSSRISQRLQALPGSATLAISSRARELTAAGREIISFGAGEPDFPTPEHILAEASRAVHDPANHHYTANAGLPQLREAIAAYTMTYSGVPTDATEVIVTNGAKQAIYQTCAALIDPGSEVLLPTPYWVTYPASIELSGGVPVPVLTDAASGFKVTVEQLEAARTSATKALIFVSPSNPTGTVYSSAEARDIGLWAARHGVWVIADEIYQRLFYGDDVAPSIAGVTPELEDVVLVNGVAKSYAMTGWRLGWLAGPRDVVDAAARLQSHATSNVSNISQQAALAALTGPQEEVEAMRQAFDKRRHLMFAGVNAISGFDCVEPNGAFYVFPDVSAVLGSRYATSDDLAAGILEEAGVALVSGESFGSPGFLRLSYALGEADIERGLQLISQHIDSI